MNGHITPAPVPNSRVTPPPRAVHAHLLDAVAAAAAAAAQDPRPSPLDTGETPEARGRRPLETTPPPSAKRARLEQDDQRPTVIEIVDDDDKPALEHPEPRPRANRPHASFLERFVDPTHHPPCAEPLHTFVSEWLQSVGPDRNKHCRSEGLVDHSDDDPISRQLTRSAPEPLNAHDAEAEAALLNGASVCAPSYRADVDTASVVPSNLPSSPQSFGRGVVDDPRYRETNLAANHIFMRYPFENLPSHLVSLIEVVRDWRGSPGPQPELIRLDGNLAALEMEGLDESQVEQYFHAKVFPYSDLTGGLRRADRQPMFKNVVFNRGTDLKISTPIPDMLYGYSREGAFSRPQQALFNSLGNIMVANAQNVLYPFLIVEFVGNVGDLWAATNACLGGSVTCVNMIEYLNHELRQHRHGQLHAVTSPTFSIAMNGTEARLFVTWRDPYLPCEDYFMQKVENYSLQRTHDFLAFRRSVRNIIDWGRKKRINDIRRALEFLLEERRKTSNEAMVAPLRPV